MKKLSLFTLMLLLLFSIIFISFAEDGNKTINIFLRDKARNIQITSKSSSIFLDTTSPIINLVNNVDSTYSNIPKTITALITEDNLKTSKYSLISSTGSCDVNTSMSNNYISGTDLIFANENFNNKKVCFKVEDEAGNITVVPSNIIEHIDTLHPTEPSYDYAYQDGYNTVSFKGDCTYELGLKFVVEDDGVVIHEENLSDPCSIDFSYTLSAPPLVHNIKYYIVDLAGNKTNEKTFKAYVDDTGYLITPADNVSITPIISFMGFSAIPNATIKIKQIGGDYIAEGTANGKGYFIVQTSQSQPLGNMQIDLEINGVLRGDIRNLTITSSSIVVPVISNESEIVRTNTKLITAEIQGSPLSEVRMYSTDQNGNRLELGTTSLDSDGNGTIPSSIQLPGGENIIYVQDTIYNISSEVSLIIVVDPFGYTYNSLTNELIPGVKITVTNCSGNTVSLPLVHGEIQENPMYTNSNGYYDSYELSGNYCLSVEKEGYTWPSQIVLSGSLNLDGTSNIGSHGQSFTVLNSPIHIDIPMDKIEVQTTSGGGGGSSGFSAYDYRSSSNEGKWVLSDEGRKIKIDYPAGIKTKTKTYNRGFNESLFIGDKYYRFMYHKGQKIKEIEFNKTVEVSITDTDFNNQTIFYKTKDDQEWKKLTGYKVNGKTITFSIDRGFILKIDYKNKDLEEKEIKGGDSVIEIEKGNFTKYPVKSFEVSITDYAKVYGKNKTFFEKIGQIDKEIILEKFPGIFEKIEKLFENKNISTSEKVILQVFYNHLGSVYISSYNEYLKTIVLSNN